MVSEKEKQYNTAAEQEKHSRSLYDIIDSLGEYFFSVLISVLTSVRNAVAGFFERNSDRLEAIWNAIKAWFSKLGKKLASPFVRYHKATKLGFSEVGRVRREKGFFHASLAFIRLIGRSLFGKRGLAYSVFNYALPVICTVLLFNIVTYANSMTYALKLSVNGDFVGYVNSETVFTEAERIVQQRINYMGSATETVTFDASYQLEAVDYSSTLTKYQLADKLLTSMGADIEYAYGMYIGTGFYGALVDKTPIEETLESLLDAYRTGAPNEKVAFEATITYEPGLYLAESIVDPEDIIRNITAKKSVATYYTAVQGDSPRKILTKLGLTMEEMARLNPGYSDDSMIYVGDKILVTQEDPVLAVTVTRTEIYNESTPYETEYYNDNTRYQGSTVVMTDGEYVTDRITAEVSYINGVEIRRNVLNRVSVEEPVTKLVAIGTKAAPPNASISDVEVGKMLWPVGGSNGGQISEMPYGYGGYYNHKGVDIAAPAGTPIYAAESGKVILAQWYYGYGKCIMIQHDNGIVTVYGHCSYLHVGVGERVTQGQCIADVGSTGQSSGNHLHFEVRINGVCMHPLNYLPWHQRAPWCVEY